MTTKRYILTQDKISNFPPKQGTDKRLVYGKKGDEVTEVSRQLDLLIVQNKKGDRFPCPLKILIEKSTR